jgi:hypothetical protein
VTELFGIPIGTVLVLLLGALAVALAVLAFLALRHPVLVKLGVRNVGRRRGRTALIVLGLMLGTAIVAVALTTGDTMSHTIRSAAVGSLGDTDELVSAKGADVQVGTGVGAATGVEYFDGSVVDTTRSTPAWRVPISSTASRRRSSNRSPSRRPRSARPSPVSPSSQPTRRAWTGSGRSTGPTETSRSRSSGPARSS